MAKQFTPFAGRKMHIDNLLARKQTILDYRRKASKNYKHETPHYYEVQAIVEGIGLVYYTTGAAKLVKAFDDEPETPIRDKQIVKDYRGYYFDGDVFTLEEEEALLREKYGIDYGSPNVSATAAPSEQETNQN